MYKSVCIHKISPCCRCNLLLVNHDCKAVPRSLFWVPNGFNELPAVLFEFYSGESRGGAHPPPPYFWTKLRPKGPFNSFGRQAPLPPPPPYLRVWMTGPPAYLNAWIQHWISQLNHGFFIEPTVVQTQILLHS